MKIVFKRILFFAICIATLLIVAQSISVTDAKASSNSSSSLVTGLLEKKCVQCHGGGKAGKKKVKGKIDLTEIIKNGIKVRDSKTWTKVIDSIESGDMPPSDSKIKMSPSEKESIVRYLRDEFNVKLLQRRMLTPLEISNSINDLFGIDDEIYNSFERLRFNENPLVQYPTIDSTKLISNNFIKDLDYGFDALTKEYVLPLSAKYKAPKTFKLRLVPEGEHSSTTFIDRDYSSLPPKPEYPKLPTPAQEAAVRLKLKEWSVIYQEYCKKVSVYDSFDIRIGRGREFMAPLNPNPHPRFYYHKNYPKGKYRITFKAKALNRDAVAKAYQLPKKITDGYKSYGWERLITEKCRLDIYFDGMHSNNFRSLAPNAKRSKLLKSFVIEDNIEKEYSFEFEIRHLNSVTFRFGNGPNGALSWIALPTKGRKEWPRGGKTRFNRPGREYKLPCIRFSGAVQFEKIGDLDDDKSFFALDSLKIPEGDLKKKVALFTELLSLSYTSPKFIKLFETLPKKLSSVEKYRMILKFIALSPEFLFIDYSGKEKKDAVRYVSYALLKKPPSDSFEKDFKLYRSGKMSSSTFADKIVKRKNFKIFLKTFIDKWLEYGTELDETKYAENLRLLPFNEETKEFIFQLFERNRPSIELFKSNYKMVNNSLAAHYGISNEGLEFYKYEMVKTDSLYNGLLGQGSFHIAKSSGVDPLPFKRAAWLYENVFDVKLPGPPNDVDVESFKKNEQVKTFKESTLIHSENEKCATCHKRIDSIAFAMHNFDTMGRRIADQDTVAEETLMKRLSKAQKTIASAFTRHLISYIIGRETTIFDKNAVNRILLKTEKNNYRLTDLLAGIIDVYFKN